MIGRATARRGLRRLVGRPRRVARYRSDLPAVAPATADRELERLLTGNLLAFWDERLIDPAGGYRHEIDAWGRRGPARRRRLVTQARTTWFFSRLARSAYGEPRHLDWAAHGVAFLRERLWDPRHGGFYWELDAAVPTDDRKHLYGQAFALLALAEFSRASGEGEALGLARELLDLADRRAHDDRLGGYVESLGRDWRPEPAGRPGPMGGVEGGIKTVNTHMHLMSALAGMVEASPGDGPRERLRELVGVINGPAVSRSPPGYPDLRRPDWTPLPGWRANYGHDVEAVWLSMRSCRALGDPDGALLPIWRDLWENTLEHGFDHERGGIFRAGEPGRPADDRSKVWWGQAEALVSARLMHERTGDPRYETAFVQLLDWLVRGQADHERGELHCVVETDGTAAGMKAGAWECPFHQGRALLECLEIGAPRY